MKVLFDQGVPVPLRKSLSHTVSTAFELGWHELSNGDLIRKAEEHGFDVMITTDQNLRYQQNLSQRRLALVVLKGTSWPKICLKVSAISSALSTSAASSYTEISLD